MSKGLEYSKILHTFICEMESTLNDKNKRNRAYAPQVFWKNKYTLELIETELKRLEKQDEILRIIKEKQVDVGMLSFYDFNCYDYNFLVYDYKRQLTQEEIDLLKEWLK